MKHLKTNGAFYEKAGVKIMTSSSVEKIDTTELVKAFVKTAKGEVVLEADMLLSAVGIKTNIEKHRIRRSWYRY
jgi:pyruvate/2-oxoglutarate dehydrogenase complex dihydrolipoamide dehydrogenase (E3) component